MVSQVNIKGFDEFSKYTETIDPKGPPVLFYFSGSKLPDGRSWCPDCVEVVKKNELSICETLDIMVNKKVKLSSLNNYEEFAKFIDNLPQKGPDVYFFFSGKKKENGRSWCIYCQIAEPVVKAFLDELKKSIIFVYVDVGDREYWKDRACPFRTDNRTNLMVIPTIIKWKGVQRLEGSQCTKRELLQMLFEDDD